MIMHLEQGCKGMSLSLLFPVLMNAILTRSLKQENDTGNCFSLERSLYLGIHLKP